jgi:hypothetical protein
LALGLHLGIVAIAEPRDGKHKKYGQLRHAAQQRVR